MEKQNFMNVSSIRKNWTPITSTGIHSATVANVWPVMGVSYPNEGKTGIRIDLRAITPAHLPVILSKADAEGNVPLNAIFGDKENERQHLQIFVWEGDSKYELAQHVAKNVTVEFVVIKYDNTLRVANLVGVVEETVEGVEDFNAFFETPVVQDVETKAEAEVKI